MTMKVNNNYKEQSWKVPDKINLKVTEKYWKSIRNKPGKYGKSTRQIPGKNWESTGEAIRMDQVNTGYLFNQLAQNEERRKKSFI